MPGTKFGSLQELAAHLIDKMYVDTRSKSAYSVIAAIQKKTIRPPEASGTYLKKLKILIQLIGNRKHISSFLPSAQQARPRDGNRCMLGIRRRLFFLASTRLETSDLSTSGYFVNTIKTFLNTFIYFCLPHGSSRRCSGIHSFFLQLPFLKVDLLTKLFFL